MRFKDFAALVALGAIWGGSFLFMRIAVPAFGPVALIAGRVSLAGLVLWLGLRLSGRQRMELRTHARHLLVLGAVNAAVPFTLIAGAELQITASLAAVLNATVPLFSAILSVVWLSERVGLRRGAGLVLGLIGVTVLLGWTSLALTRGTVLSVCAVLVACVCYAFSGVYAKRHLAGVPTSTLALGQQIGATAWLIVPAMFRLPQLPIPHRAVWALLGLGILCTASAHLLYFHLIAQIGPVRTYTVTYLIPFFGMAWGALFLGEKVTHGMLLGLAIILSSVMLVNEVPLTAITRWWRPSVADRPEGGEAS